MQFGSAGWRAWVGVGARALSSFGTLAHTRLPPMQARRSNSRAVPSYEVNGTPRDLELARLAHLAAALAARVLREAGGCRLQAGESRVPSTAWTRGR